MIDLEYVCLSDGERSGLARVQPVTLAGELRCQAFGLELEREPESVHRIPCEDPAEWRVVPIVDGRRRGRGRLLCVSHALRARR